MSTKVLVIGGGLAGMVAAIAATEEGEDTTIIDRGSIGTGTNTALAGGVFAGSSSSYSQEEYVQ